MEHDNDKLAQLFSESMSNRPDSFNERLTFNSQSRSDEAWALEELISSLSDMDKRLKDESEERKREDAKVFEYTKKVNQRTFAVSIFTLIVGVMSLFISISTKEPGNRNAVDDSDYPASYSYTTEENSNNLN